EGKFGITDIIPSEGFSEEEVLVWGASLEQNSEHPIAAGIVKSARDQGIALKSITEFNSITGKGIEGIIEGKKVNVVSPGFVNSNNMDYDKQKFNEMSEVGKTVIFVLLDDELISMIALADIIRVLAEEAIDELKKKGVYCIMLIGDNVKVVNCVAEQLNI